MLIQQIFARLNQQFCRVGEGVKEALYQIIVYQRRWLVNFYPLPHY